MTSLPTTADLRLTDGVVVLRRHRDADVDGLVAQCTDPETVATTTVPHPYTRDHAEAYLTLVADGWAAGSSAAFAIEADGRFCGSVNLDLHEGSWAEIGYGLGPWARGRGLMTRAARLVLHWGLTDLALAGVHWRAVAGNTASWRVAEKCGFRREGTVRGLLVHRGERFDGWIGSLLAGELTPPA